MNPAKLSIACILAAVALTSALAAADDRFSYRRAELETPEGLEALLERIERTAHMACRAEPVLPPHYGRARALCEKALITDIVSKIDDSRLYVAARKELGLEFSDPDADRVAATE